MFNFLQILVLNLLLVFGTSGTLVPSEFNGDKEKAEAYQEGLERGEAKAQIDGAIGIVDTITNLDGTIAGIQEVIANPEKTFDKIAMSFEDWNKQLTLALETDPKLAGEMMGYLQGQGKFLPNAATSTVVLTGPIAVKLANLVKGGSQPNVKSDVGG